MECSPNCWLCHLTYFGAEFAGTCGTCLDDWLCGDCANECGLTDEEDDEDSFDDDSVDDASLGSVTETTMAPSSDAASLERAGSSDESG